MISLAFWPVCGPLCDSDLLIYNAHEAYLCKAISGSGTGLFTLVSMR